MRFLVIETSVATGAVAAADADRLLAVRTLPAARRHARDLVPLAAETLTEVGWRPAELDAVIVNCGPGSFTGLRVGLTAAKTLAAVHGLALVAIDALAASALHAADGRDEACVRAVADALRQRVFAASFRVAGGLAAPLGSAATMLAEDWLATLRPGELVAGPAAPSLAARLPTGVRIAAPERCGPGLAALHRLGVAAYRAGQRDDPDTLEPAYLAASSAEEKRAAPTEPPR
jgi:tRNA threonylcarbamoyladenosine biosynthesis protein TsaB